MLCESSCFGTSGFGCPALQKQICQFGFSYFGLKICDFFCALAFPFLKIWLSVFSLKSGRFLDLKLSLTILLRVLSWFIN